MHKLTALFVLSFLSLSLIAEEWTQRTSIPGPPRHHPVTWGIGDYGYVLTGGNAQNTPLNDFYRYNPTLDAWEQLPNFPGIARSYSIGAVYDGIGYIGFGSTETSYLNDLWGYDPVTEEWKELNSCPCLGRQHPAFVAHNGHIYVGFGNNNTNLNDWWGYNIDTDTWEELPEIPGIPRHHPYHFAIGDYVYTGLGHAAPGITIMGDWYRYHPPSQTWTQMNDFPGEERVAGSQFAHRDYGYVLSGDGSDHSFMDEGEFWQYNPEADTWNQLPSHPNESRWAPNAFVVHDTVYFTSGVNKATGFILNDVWSFELPVPLVSSSPEINENLLKLDVYPNPASDVIFLRAKNEAFLYSTMRIYDLNGRKLLESPFQQELKVNGFSDGLYLMHITHQNKLIYSGKFEIIR